MQFPIFVTLVTLITYQILSISVSAARGKYKITAPATTGNINFERVYRTHLNYLENLVIFLPLVWIDSLEFGGSIFFLVPAISWLISKILFSVAYIKNWDFKVKLAFNIGATISVLTLFILGIISLF
jgi:glutathione S-transferase